MRWFDYSSGSTFITELEAGRLPLFLMILMLVLLFFGGWAGFFLMISSIGNMISMFKGLEKGQSAKSLAIKQIIGGFLLLFFAYLSEGIIGYKGAIGELAKGNENWWQLIFTRGYHTETIHAVAWCVIINGIVQAILSYNGGWKKIKRNIKIYAILAVIIIAVTQFVWNGFDALAGESWANGSNELITGGSVEWDRGHLLYYDFFTNFLYIFAAPWAGSVEPLFPFIAVSFIGSMIGLYLMKRKDEPENKDTKTLKIGIGIGFFIALAGFLIMVFMIIEGADAVYFFREGSNIPALNTDFQWLAWFLFVTGSQIGAILFILRVVEFRGKSKQFAKKTLFFRRFGFVAFSVYNFQMIDIVAVLLVGLIPGIAPFVWGQGGHFYLNDIWFALIGIFVLWGVVLWLWEKVNYVFGLEWFIAKISAVLIPSKRKKTEGEKQPWWKTPRLDPQASLMDAEWIDIISTEQTEHENLKDSKLAKKVALCGLIFPPAYFISLGITKESMKTEGVNKHNKAAKIINIIGIILTIVIVTLLFVLQTDILIELGLF
jgi:hypothetical protein